jgi:hypothetical protein
MKGVAGRPKIGFSRRSVHSFRFPSDCAVTMITSVLGCGTSAKLNPDSQ